MDGLYVGNKRPASKKAVKEALAANPDEVYVESTSMFGGFSGSASNITEGMSIYFVGPDPHTSRKFYGSITRIGGKLVLK